MIDILTFMLSLGVGNIAFALLMACYMRGATPSPSLTVWIWARLLSGVAQVCCWLAPQFGFPLAGKLASFASVAGVALELAAYCLFFGFAHWRRFLYPASAAGMAVVAAALLAGATREQMICVVTMIVALFAAGAAAVLLRPQSDAPLMQRLIGANDALFALAIWATMGVTRGNMAALGTSSLVGFAYMASYLLMIVNGFGFLLMCKQKDDAHMQRLATVDCLTGALNRRAFFERAESARMLALRLRKPIALVMLDLDHFKRLNDNFGHACGDEALRLFARTAGAALRDHDLIGRLGGEEFALALPGTTLDGAIQAAERLRLAVAAAPLPCCPGEYRVTVSIGLVLIGPNEALTAALARADHALYAAKSGGRNRIEVGEAILKCA